MTELKKDIFYTQRVLADSLGVSYSWLSGILGRSEFRKFEKLTTTNPVKCGYSYRFCDDFLNSLKKYYRPRQNLYKQTFLSEVENG